MTIIAGDSTDICLNRVETSGRRKYFAVRHPHPQADGTDSKVAWAHREANRSKKRNQMRSDTYCDARERKIDRPAITKPSASGPHHSVLHRCPIGVRRPLRRTCHLATGAREATNPMRTAGCAAKSSCSGGPAERLPSISGSMGRAAKTSCDATPSDGSWRE
jgi:hypothetical protein